MPLDHVVDGQLITAGAENAHIDVTNALSAEMPNKLDLAGGTMSGEIDMSGNRVIDVGTPSASTDASTKGYVDSVASGLVIKKPARVGTTANLTATYDNGASGVGATLTNSGTQAALVIDGVTLSVNDRVFVLNQTNPECNGPYVVTNVGSGSTNWELTRATDANSSMTITPGLFAWVLEGTVNHDVGFVLITDTSPIVVGTTELDFIQFTGEDSIVAGPGLSRSGNTIRIATDYAGQTSIDTVGTVTTGTWNASLVTVAYGGTGASDATTARTNLGLAIGTNVQAFSLRLGTLASLGVTTGNIIVGDGSDWTAVGVGSNGQVFTADSTQPGGVKWAAGGGGGMAIGGSITGATAQSILYVAAGGVLAQDNTRLYWDDTNKMFVVNSDFAAGISAAVVGKNCTVASGNANLLIETSDSYGADKGGSLAFMGKYSSGGGTCPLAYVYGRKENGSDGSQAGYLSLATRQNGGGVNEGMRITSAGKVGINNSSPTGFLHVTLPSAQTSPVVFDLGAASNDQGVLITSSGTEAACEIKNTASGGKRWQIVSTGGGAGSGQGQLGFYNATDGVLPLLLPPGNARPILLPVGTSSGQTGGVALRELAANGSHAFTLRAADAMSADVVMTLPAADAAGALTSDGAGTFSYTPYEDGSVVQSVKAETTSSATGTTLIPQDDTIPQNTEGTEFITVTITPTSSSNKLRITLNAWGGHSIAGHVIAAIFQDSTANALDARMVYSPAANTAVQFVLEKEITAGTTSATTFKARIGGSSSDGSATFTLNGQSGSRLFGGVAATSLTVEEVRA